MQSGNLKQVIEGCVRKICADETLAETSEWNLTHHLACCLEKHFPEYNVDVELLKEPGNQRPDVIIHKRDGLGVNGENYVIIEAKKGEISDEDKEKIKNLGLKLYKYKFGFVVAFSFDIRSTGFVEEVRI